jgi:hypothetical protein
MLKALYIIIKCRAKIPADEQEWFVTRWDYACFLWGMQMSLASMKMEHWYIIEDLFGDLDDADRNKIQELRNEIADAKAFAFNMLPTRTEDDLKDTLDEQLQLLYLYIEGKR